ncbi:GspH/FimT family protein [Pseudomonas sp. App30]|uniref:GspH/FimT family pseudopilin n=1 Tax=Pseudomonas sp. App30 TaxID=3068990 RepID=UPI003A8071DD
MKAAGFTLLELLLVIVLMAVALGVLSFGLGRGLEAARERQALRDIVGALRQARTQSVLSGLPQEVRFDLPGHRFQAPGQALGHWPADLGLQLTTAADLGAAVAFFPDGSSSGGHLLLARGAQAWRIDVGWLLGDVRLQALP